MDQGPSPSTDVRNKENVTGGMAPSDPAYLDRVTSVTFILVISF